MAKQKTIKLSRNKQSATSLGVNISNEYVPADAGLHMAVEGAFVAWGCPTTWPFCIFDSMEEEESGGVLKIVGKGRLDNLDDRPFAFKLDCTSDAYRATFVGEFLEFPDEHTYMHSVCMCLRYPGFAAENKMPFDMARKSFFFDKEKGFCWLSDGQRTRSEAHGDQDGVWIQTVCTDLHARQLASWKKDRNLLPWCYGGSPSPNISAGALVGWVADDNKYLIATASENAYQVGIRWGPCLHSDPGMVTPSGEKTRTLKSIVYVLPVDLDKLLELYKEDFGNEGLAGMRLPADALWPVNVGALLDGLEGDTLKKWKADKGTVSTYQPTSKTLWVNGNFQKGRYPEGITEGKGSMLWEIPAGSGKATLTRIISAPKSVSGPFTHLAIDAVNRGEAEVDIKLAVSSGKKQIGLGTFRLNYWANRRLLVPLADYNTDKELEITMQVAESKKPTRLVLDNLRGFQKGTK